MKTNIILLSVILASVSLQSFAADPVKRAKPKFLPGASSPRNAEGNPVGKVDAPQPPGNGFVRPSPPAALLPVAEPYAPKMLNLAQFNTFAALSEGIIKGAAVKFLIDNRTQPAKINFINGNYVTENGIRPEYVQFHYLFAQQFLNVRLDAETFNNQTYFTNDLQKKKFIAGTLQTYTISKDGVNTTILGVQFYPQDAIAEQTLAHALTVVRQAVQITELPMVFVSYGSQQTAAQIQPQLASLNIKASTVNDIYAGIPYIPMHLGTACGYLRLFPKGAGLDDLNPKDIPVFDELPLDLSVVAGVITTVVQDAGAHVNLKSKERNTPNMVLRDLSKIDELKNLNNRPVKLSVEGESYKIIESTDQEVELCHKKNNKPWVKVVSGKDTEVISFDDLAAANTVASVVKKSDSYGGKASKLGLLAHKEMAGIGSRIQKKFNYRMTPIGFGIPVTYYFEFLKANPKLKAVIDDLIKREMSLEGAKPMTSAERVQKVAEIQSMFYAAKMPQAMVDLLAKKATELKALGAKYYPKTPIKKVKVRSSANAEDIPNFDGAGLHSSYSAKLENIGTADEACRVEISQDGVATKEEMVPESLVCAVKGVYASLWNKRAIEERTYARIDQRTAAMGIAVNTSYDFRKKTEGINEVANAVLVTRVINSKGVYGYRLSLNTSENLVTNPTPGTQSEVVIASFTGLNEKPTYSVIQYAKTDAGAEPLKTQLLSQDYYQRMVEIAQTIEVGYCRNIPSYYPGGQCDWAVSDPEKPASLDMEFKIFSNGEVLLKQVREFSGK